MESRRRRSPLLAAVLLGMGIMLAILIWSSQGTSYGLSDPSITVGGSTYTDAANITKSGTGWSWDGSTATLNIDWDYTGEPIKYNRTLNLVCKQGSSFEDIKIKGDGSTGSIGIQVQNGDLNLSMSLVSLVISNVANGISVSGDFIINPDRKEAYYEGSQLRQFGYIEIGNYNTDNQLELPISAYGVRVSGNLIAADSRFNIITKYEGMWIDGKAEFWGESVNSTIESENFGLQVDKDVILDGRDALSLSFQVNSANTGLIGGGDMILRRDASCVMTAGDINAIRLSNAGKKVRLEGYGRVFYAKTNASNNAGAVVNVEDGNAPIVVTNKNHYKYKDDGTANLIVYYDSGIRRLSVAPEAGTDTWAYFSHKTSHDGALDQDIDKVADEGWSWSASQKELTLSGFNGGLIYAEGDLTINLADRTTNTITVPECYFGALYSKAGSILLKGKGNLIINMIAGNNNYYESAAITTMTSADNGKNLTDIGNIRIEMDGTLNIYSNRPCIRPMDDSSVIFKGLGQIYCVVTKEPNADGSVHELPWPAVIIPGKGGIYFNGLNPVIQFRCATNPTYYLSGSNSIQTDVAARIGGISYSRYTRTRPMNVWLYTSDRIASVKLSQTGFVYDGKVHDPEVSVWDNRGDLLTRDTDYKLVYDGDRTQIGKHQICVEGLGKYAGDRPVQSIQITAPTVSTAKISKLIRGRKAVTVRWAKVSAAKGYQIQAALNRSFKKGLKKKTVTKYSKKGVTIKKLKAKKYYYVRVRAYRAVGGKTFYGNWSTVKKIKTK